MNTSEQDKIMKIYRIINHYKEIFCCSSPICEDIKHTLHSCILESLLIKNINNISFNQCVVDVYYKYKKNPNYNLYKLRDIKSNKINKTIFHKLLKDRDITNIYTLFILQQLYNNKSI